MLRNLAIALVLSTTAVAGATPAPTATITTVDIDDEVVTALAEIRTQASEEPGGILIPGDVGVTVQRAGLRGGDIIRRINNQLPGEIITIASVGVTVLEVDRKGQLMILHVVRAQSHAAGELDDDDITSYVADFRNGGATGLTRSGKASGVRIVRDVRDILQAGDIVRSIDRQPVTTVGELADRLTAIGDTASIKVDRDDRPLTIDLKRLHAVDTSHIVKRSETSYEIPQELVDYVLASPTLAAKGARMVPSVHDGKPDGFKLYAIRPSSLYAHLGLQNGDTVLRINGIELDTPEKALGTFDKLRTAKKFTLDITRRGKPLTLTYTITTGTK